MGSLVQYVGHDLTTEQQKELQMNFVRSFYLGTS